MEKSDRIEKLLAAILLNQMGDAPDHAKMVVLKRVGFENQDVAKLLGTSPAVVSQRLYEARQDSRGKAGGRKNKKAR